MTKHKTHTCSECKQNKTGKHFEKDISRDNGVFPICNKCFEILELLHARERKIRKFIKSSYAIPQSEWKDNPYQPIREK